MSLPFAVEAIAIGEGWAGIDSSSTDQSLAFFQCCKTHDRGVIQIDIASTGYLTEAENALNGACFVVLYQGYYSGMWADPSTGTTRGQEAVSAAQNVDYPGGCTIYLDVQHTDSVSATTVIDWINNWGTADIRSKIGNRLDENAIVTRQAPKDHFPEVEERSPGRSSRPQTV